MKIIGIFAQKGGVGKTHLGTNWAVEAERSGIGCVAILDLDPQGTAASWSQRRLDYQGGVGKTHLGHPHHAEGRSRTAG